MEQFIIISAVTPQSFQNYYTESILIQTIDFLILFTFFLHLYIVVHIRCIILNRVARKNNVLCDTKPTVQSQKMVKGLNVRLRKKRVCTVHVSKAMPLDWNSAFRIRVYAKKKDFLMTRPISIYPKYPKYFR